MKYKLIVLILAVSALCGCGQHASEQAASILESRRLAYMQGDSSLLDYLMAVRVYNDTAEQCIGARSGLAAAATELLHTLGL